MADELERVREIANRIETRKTRIREQEQETERELREREEWRDTAPYHVPEGLEG